MIELLAKLFIKDRKNIGKSKVRQAYGMLCGGLGIALNFLLFAGKFLAGTISGSIAITADAFNNLSDAGASVVTLAGFRLAGQKPDPEHPFGHGRMEYISGMVVAMLILLMGFELVKSAVGRILTPQDLEISPLILVILAVSVLVKGYMALYNFSYSKKLDSGAMKATATDSISDAVATGVVLICTLISHFTGISLDGYCGLGVGVLVFWAGVRAAKETIDPLLGQAPEPEFVEQIKTIVMADPDIIGIHDLIVHNYGPGRVLISLHAEVPSTGDILALHDKIDLIEHKLRDTLQCSAVIHMDPVCIGDRETEVYKSQVQGYLASIDERLTLHDFRIVKGPTHTNLIFDVVVPFQFRMTDRQLVQEITRLVQADHPNFFTVIEVDKQYY
jgi:cation diffusion facilitator family transporter